MTVLGRPFGGSARVQGVRVAVGEACVKALAGPGVLPRGGVGVGGGRLWGLPRGGVRLSGGYY